MGYIITWLSCVYGVSAVTTNTGQSRCEGWAMLRVRQSTHQRLTALQLRRERARAQGRLIFAPHEIVTQDDVVGYLLDHEASTQERRKRARKRRTTRQSAQRLPCDSEASLYTATTKGEPTAGDE